MPRFKRARQTRNKNEEHQLQCWLAEWLHLLGVLYCASVGADIKVTIGTAVKMKKAGYKKGYPDMFICEPRGKYHGLYIELKGATTKTSPEQIVWNIELKKRGYYAVIMPKLEYIAGRNWLEILVTTYLEGGL